MAMKKNCSICGKAFAEGEEVMVGPPIIRPVAVDGDLNLCCFDCACRYFAPVAELATYMAEKMPKEAVEKFFEAAFLNKDIEELNKLVSEELDFVKEMSQEARAKIVRDVSKALEKQFQI